MSTNNGDVDNMNMDEDEQIRNEDRNHENYANKAEVIKYFYRYSDFSTQAIAEHVSMPISKVQEIVDELIKNDALDAFIEESSTRVEKIMSEDVVSLDYSSSIVDAASLMAKNEIGSIIITKRRDNDDVGDDSRTRRHPSTASRPYGIVTERDMVRRLDPVMVGSDFYFRNTLLGHICSHPLIAAHRGLTVYDAAEITIKNRIRKLPILSSQGDKIIGIVTTTDLAMFLSPSKRPGLVSSLLQAISRGRKAAKQKTRQKEQLSKKTDTSFDPLRMYICRTCLKKFDNIEEMEKHVLTEHRKKGEIA